MADKRKNESDKLGTMRSFEEYCVRVFPIETERRRFDSNDPSVLGKAVADRVIKSTRPLPSLIADRRGRADREIVAALIPQTVRRQTNPDH